MEVDLLPILENLKTVSDKELRYEISALNLHIPDERFNNAFYCYGITKFLSAVDTDLL